MRCNGCFLWVTIIGTVALAADPPGLRITTESRQFTVETPDARLSAALAAQSERLKAALLRRLQLPDRWAGRVYVLICLRKDTEARPLTLLPQSLSGQLHFLLRAETPPPLDQGEFFRALTQILCSEIANRPRGEVRDGQPLALPPLWLTEGLWQAVGQESTGISNREIHQALLQRALAAGRLWTWWQLADTAKYPAEESSAQIFGAYAQTAVESLLSLQNGARKMQQFLQTLPPEGDWRHAFRKVYEADFANEAAVETWWTERLRTRARQIFPQALSARETERRLETILLTRVFVTDAKTGERAERPLEVLELAGHRELEGMSALLDEKLAALAALQGNAHPLFREPLQAYLMALTSLRQNAVRQFEREARRAQDLHRIAQRHAGEIAHYLDELEGRGREGLALSLRGIFVPPDEFQPPPSGSTIGNYLDRVEGQP